MYSRFTSIAGLLTVILLATGSVRGATLTVTNLGNTGEGSLRAAITAANNTSETDVIVFDLAGPGPHTIPIPNALPAIVNSLTFLNDRPGDEAVTLQRSGTVPYRILSVNVVGPEVVVAGLTLSNGDVSTSFGPPNSQGGAIRSVSYLLTRNCTFSGNAAREGGAIYATNTIAVLHCTFTANSATMTGGGIGGSAGTIRNATFSGNSAGGSGGAIYNANGVATVESSTFRENSAGGGGAIRAGSAVNAVNCVFDRGAAGENITGSFVSGGNNLSDDAAGGDNGTAPGGLLNGPGDIRNTEPNLAALADNGGLTPTCALLGGSAAIDAGNGDRAPFIDQRNYSRSGPTDIGSYEFNGTPAPPSPAVYTVTNTNDSGVGSLRFALATAAEDSTIVFAPDVTGVITLTTGQLVIEKNVVIQGPGASVVAIDANGTGRVLLIQSVFTPSLTVSISGLTIRGGRFVNHTNYDGGGGIASFGNLTLEDCVVTGNAVVGADAPSGTLSRPGMGGGIHGHGTVTLVRTAVTSNTAVGGNSISVNSFERQGGTGSGGGIYHSGQLTLTDCVIDGNQATGGLGAPSGSFDGGMGGVATGGGIYHSGYSAFRITGSAITRNQANGGNGGAGEGARSGGVGGRGVAGGIYCASLPSTLTDVNLSDNTSRGGRGGDGGTTGGQDGGGGASFGGGMTVVSDTDVSALRTTFSYNRSFGGESGRGVSGAPGGDAYGGAISAADEFESVTALTLTNCTVTSNSAVGGEGTASSAGVGRGGGIFLFYHSGVLVNYTTLSDNVAASEGTNTSTNTGQGGNVYFGVGKSARLAGTIVAGGIAIQGRDVLGTVASDSSYNLVGDGTGLAGISHANNGNKVGTAQQPIDPLLGPLQDNGGATETRALSAGSPAIDSGNNATAPLRDQRGYGRNSVSDIGAFEFNGFIPVAPHAEFSGDLQSDIIWQNNATGQRGIWLMNGAEWVGERFLPTIPIEWQIAASADFNGDGHNDLVWQNLNTGVRGIWLMDGSTWMGERFLPTIPVEWQIKASGDFNGDGHPDLVWQNRNTGGCGIWLMNGTSWMGERFLPTVPTEWQIAGADEFDGDGQTDLLWENVVTGERGIWLMQGTTLGSVRFLPTIPTEWRMAGTGEFNGDGKADIVWQNTASGQRGIWLMDGTTWVDTRFLPTIPLEWEIRNH